MFKLEKVCEHVYQWTFKDAYDMAMHCLRVSEFKESTNDQFQEKAFDIIDYVDWYMRVASADGTWSYPDDWAGFNIRAIDFKRTYEDCRPTDWNRFDHIAYGIYKYIYSKEGSDFFYVIAYVEGDTDTFEHEFAHALFKIDEEYKFEMTEAVEALTPGKKLFRLKKILKEKMLYREKIHVDEIQAYFATDLPDEFPAHYVKYRKPFIDIYKKYRKKHLGK